MIGLSIPSSLLVSRMHTSLERVGESTGNPFEGIANDVPITQLSRDIEADRLEILGEPGPPATRGSANDIAL